MDLEILAARLREIIDYAQVKHDHIHAAYTREDTGMGFDILTGLFMIKNQGNGYLIYGLAAGGPPEWPIKALDNAETLLDFVDYDFRFHKEEISATAWQVWSERQSSGDQ